MSANPTKQFILPFTAQKNGTLEAEAAAVFAVAELERNKGGGLVIRHSEERLAFITKIGYPLWLYPKNDLAFVFDGFNDANYVIPYPDLPSTKTFMGNLETNLRPREKFLAFLSENEGYFQQPVKDEQFVFRGLMRDTDFEIEFNIYRTEAENTTPSDIALLSPVLDERAISFMLGEFEKLQFFQKEETERLTEAIKLLNNTASQHQTELDFEASAVKEETDAKLKAQEELINPKVVELNKNYRHKIKTLTDTFDQEIERLQKLKAKALRVIESEAQKIKSLQREAKVHAETKHKIREKQTKEKIKQNQKGLKNLKKELKNAENKLKKAIKQKNQGIAKLHFELDAAIKLARQPLLELEDSRDTRVQAFRAESDKLFKLNMLVIDELNKSIAQREVIKNNFDALSIKDPSIRSPALYYIPFFVVCYEVGATRRYLMMPPSRVCDVDFSTKLKGALGMSKIKCLTAPRFKAVTALIFGLQQQTKQNPVFESQLRDFSEKSNLLKSSAFWVNVEKGLDNLKSEGWISKKEHQTIVGQLEKS